MRARIYTDVIKEAVLLRYGEIRKSSSGEAAGHGCSWLNALMEENGQLLGRGPACPYGISANAGPLSALTWR